MIELAVTFDVEQWDARSREDHLRALLAALQGFNATWFVAEDETQSTSARYRDILLETMRQGHEIAAHVHFQTRDTLRQLENVRDATERLRGLGAPCTSFRGGGHVFDDHLADELVRLGYRVDSSAVPGLVRTFPTRGGTTVAAYGDIWHCGPYWWRPGLLELPLAAFPLSKPWSFFRQRFRVPLLVADAEEYGRRLTRLAKLAPDRDLAVVVLGHSYDVETNGRLRALRAGLAQLHQRFGVRFRTVATLAERILSGQLEVGIGERPAGLRRLVGRCLELGFRARARLK